MVYKLFSDKQGLGRALVLREAQRFISAVLAALAKYPNDPTSAVTAAMSAALAEGERNPLLKVMVHPPADGPDSLVSTLTTDAGLVLDLVTEALMPWADTNFPSVDPDALRRTLDILVRGTVSMLLQPPAHPDESVRDLAGMAMSWLGDQSP